MQGTSLDGGSGRCLRVLLLILRLHLSLLLLSHGHWHIIYDRVTFLLVGGYLLIGVDAVVHLDRRLLFGGFDNWGGGLGRCAAPSVRVSSALEVIWSTMSSAGLGRILVAETFLSEAEQSSILIVAFSMVGSTVGAVRRYRCGRETEGSSRTGFGR